MYIEASTNCCSFFTDVHEETVFAVPLVVRAQGQLTTEVRLEIVESECDDNGDPVNRPSDYLGGKEVVVLTPDNGMVQRLLPVERVPHNGYVAIRLRNLLPWNPPVTHFSYSGDGSNPRLSGSWFIYHIDVERTCTYMTSRRRAKDAKIVQVSNIRLEKLKVD